MFDCKKEIREMCDFYTRDSFTGHNVQTAHLLLIQGLRFTNKLSQDLFNVMDSENLDIIIERREREFDRKYRKLMTPNSDLTK